MGFVPVPLHHVHLQCDLVSGVFKVGVCPDLPVKGVQFILGNDIAGGRVLPMLEVLDCPNTYAGDSLPEHYPGVFPVCAVTRAQSRVLEEVVDLSDSFLRPVGAVEEVASTPVSSPGPGANSTIGCHGLGQDGLMLPMTRDNLISMQKVDSTLEACFGRLVTPGWWCRG